MHRPKNRFQLLDQEVEVEDCDPHSRLAAALVNELFRDFQVDTLPLEETSGLLIAAEFADELNTLLDHGMLVWSGSVLSVPEPVRDQWVYWDKLLYPAEWIERRRQVDRPRVR